MNRPIQLLFIVETKGKNKSDHIYVSEILKHFYGDTIKRNDFRYDFIYLNGKYNALKPNTEIDRLRKYWKKEMNGKTYVINILDKDDFDKEPKDRDFVKAVTLFCEQNQYELVWFVRDIEHVMLNKRVDNNKKTQEASNFKKGRRIANVHVNNIK